MLVKIVHVKYCPANWQTALQQHRFSTFGGVTPPPHTPPNSYAPVIIFNILSRYSSFNG